MLKLHAEVEIPDYLLSGLEARLFGATGDWQRRPRPDARGDLAHPEERYPWEPKLTTRVCIDTEYRWTTCSPSARSGRTSSSCSTT